METRETTKAGWRRGLLRYGFTVVEILLVLGGGALVLFATQPYGSGVSTDAAAYLAGADHIALGEGFLDYRGEPILWWPPLYSSLLALLRRMLGITVLAAGRYVNAAVHGGFIYFSGRLFGELLPGRPVWRLAAMAVIASSVSTLALAANIGADAFFNLLVVLFLLQAIRWRDNHTPLRFWTLVALAGLSPLFRFSAVTLIGGGTLLMLLPPGDLKQRWRRTLLFGSASSLPLLAWLIGRNYRLYGSLSGSRDLSAIDVPGNLRFAVPRLAHWAVPYQIMDRLPAAVVVAAGILLVASFIVWGHPGFIWRRHRDKLIPLLSFSILYAVFVLVTTFTPDHIFSYDDRYYTPLLAPLTGMLFLALSDFLERFKRPVRKSGSYVLLASFALWLIYPVHLTSKFVRASREKGVPFYNLHHTAALQDSVFTEAVQAFPFEQDAYLYSNFPASVYVQTGYTTDIPPRDADHPRADPALLGENIVGWPEATPAYLIWYLPDDRPMYYDPESLNTLRPLDLLIELEDGLIYAVGMTP